MAEKVLDFIGKRKENIEQKRRAFERIVFKNFLGAYTVINQDGVIYPVELVDVSKEGCLFQVPWNVKKDSKIEHGTEVKMRLYFSKQSYIPCLVNVKYGNEFVGQDGLTYMQYGCEFDKSMPSFEALNSFIDFLYKFAEHSTIDKGDAKAFFY
tara:strand:+ start:61132 stop:61590 length:459 start_codon:yes stop_codon:yes gene_type:complete